ncbi:CHAT domain-containing protein [Mucilaginibacter gossypii]|uniref:CHAT domain-containing protein n=1 Tax=Mucilaginibacter gossypii TaxID=551996 RepID=UPI0015A46CB5
MISILVQNRGDAPLLLKAYISTGAYLQVLGRSKEAIPYFKGAINFQKKTHVIPDSALFKPLVYCGNSYYLSDQLDSASYFYSQAKEIAEKYPQVAEIERMYNTMGLIAYSTGNYIKSITYYEKALTTIQARQKVDYSLLVAYKSNLASAYRHLKNYNAALTLYKEILPFHIESDKINHNIASLYIAMGDNESAINHLKKVKYEDLRKLNDFGKTYLQQNDFAAAKIYLQKAVLFNKKINGPHKSSDYGVTLKYLGDLYLKQKQFTKSLASYQQAIGNFLVSFHSRNIYNNPVNFNTAFNITELLDVLLAKAKAFDLLYQQQGNTNDLEASLAAYFSFYKLANHIERFYESDEARLVVSERKYATRMRPIAICLELYKLKNDRKNIEEALYFDEENKASILSLNLDEKHIRANNVPLNLLEQETTFKESITHLSIKAAGETDSLIIDGIKRQINDLTIKLLSVQQKIGNINGSLKDSLENSGVNLKTLQRKIAPKTAILSYHIGETQMLCFIITKNNFSFVTVNLAKNYKTILDTFYRAAESFSGKHSDRLRLDSRELYKQWMLPVKEYIEDKKSLVIIPDGELNYLPFELLMDNDGNELVKEYFISYNYSCNILQNSKKNKAEKNASILSIAPFANGKNLLAESTLGLARLSSSKAEIESIGGKTLLDQDATKRNFIKLAGRFNIIHLATHAYANDVDPNRSFIAFYPTRPDSVLSFHLFQPEIYNLKLNKTSLIVLSACESGTGEFVNGEGVMSLSRAFSYAGCHNIITSMWKADDASTAYISARFHKYLSEGNMLSQALQKAKLDYLEDDSISPRKKTPSYWANMRLIASLEEPPDLNYNVYIIAAVLLVGCILLILKTRCRI